MGTSTDQTDQRAPDDPMQRFAVNFGRALGLTFGGIMVFVLLVAGGLSAFVGASVSIGAGALRAGEIGFVVGLGYAILLMVREGERATGVGHRLSVQDDASAFGSQASAEAVADALPLAPADTPGDLKVA